jgi:polysaccharide deacetylase family protein (PEP-CTERM system associated)
MNVANLLTFDVEDWYQGVPAIPASDWPAFESSSRIVASTERLLSLLAEHDATATFFVVARLGETHPDLVRRIAAAGHEIGTHGYHHRFVHHLSPSQFRQDLRRSIDILGALAQAPIRGYRAPYFSIDHRCRWALDVLLEEGIAYDASLFPVRTPLYGTQCSDRIGPVRTPSGALLMEIPMATYRYAGLRIPVTGGFYLRALPLWLTLRAVRSLNAVQRSVIYYGHPWEFDPSPPAKRPGITALERIVHYGFQHRAEPRLRRLLEIAQFTSIRDAEYASVVDACPQ